MKVIWRKSRMTFFIVVVFFPIFAFTINYYRYEESAFYCYWRKRNA